MIGTPCNIRIGAFDVMQTLSCYIEYLTPKYMLNSPRLKTNMVRFASLGYYKTCLLISDIDLSLISEKRVKGATRYQNATKRRGSSIVKHWKTS